MTHETDPTVSLDALAQLELVRSTLCHDASRPCQLLDVEWGVADAVVRGGDAVRVALDAKGARRRWTLVRSGSTGDTALCSGLLVVPPGEATDEDVMTLERAALFSRDAVATAELPAPARWQRVARYEAVEAHAEAADLDSNGVLLRHEGSGSPARRLVVLEAHGAGSGHAQAQPGWAAEERLVEELREVISALQHIPRDMVGEEEPFSHFGLDSITLGELSELLSERLGLSLTPDIFFRYGSCVELASGLVAGHAAWAAQRYETADAPRQTRVLPVPAPSAVSARERPAGTTSHTGGFVSIIGLSGRFPGARDVGQLWKNLRAGDCAITQLPVDRPGYPSNWSASVAGWLPGVAEFDPRFFAISPKEAEQMDPRQRLLMQEMWRALEDAGVGERTLRSHRVGLFVGVENGDYAHHLGHDEDLTGANDSVLAARLAYFLDLHGPVLAINTACSSGLVALHEARASLERGECDIAVVAAANILTHPRTIEAMSAAGMLSTTGSCRAFDRRADGMVPGEAVVALVLEDGDKARGEGRRVRADVLGSGVNHDGRTQGITAPNGAAQADLISSVMAQSGVSPAQVGLVIAHGTGTPLGDPVEVKALAAVMGSVERDAPALLMSTKPSIGHCQAASGLVSTVVATCALTSGEVPVSICCEEPSDYVDWDATGLRVCAQTQPWPQAAEHPVAAVSAFGVSGTNAHVLLRAPSPADSTSWPEDSQILLVSGATEESLRRQCADLAVALRDRRLSLAPVARTLAEGRHHLACRAAVVAATSGEAVHALEELAQGQSAVSRVPRGFRPNRAQETALEEMLRGAHGADKATRGEVLRAVADSYSQGYVSDLSPLWGASQPPLVSLPGTVFATDTYWVGEQPRAQSPESAGGLAGRNASTVGEGLRTRTRLRPADPLVADHRLDGVPTLPAAGHLAVLCDAARILDGRVPGPGAGLRLTGLSIQRPVVVTGETDVVVRAEEMEDGSVLLTLGYGPSGAPPQDASSVVLEALAAPTAADPVEPGSAGMRPVDSEQLYRMLGRVGLDYGAAYRTVTGVLTAGEEASVTAGAAVATWDAAVVRPDVLDGVLQAIGVAQPGSSEPGLPVGAESITVHRAMPARVVARVRHLGRRGRLTRFDIDVADTDGALVLEINGLTTAPAADSPVESEVSLLAPGWAPLASQDSGASEASAAESRDRHVAVVGACADPRALGADTVVHHIPLTGAASSDDYEEAAQGLLRLSQELVGLRPARPVLLQVLVPEGLAGGLVGMVATISKESRRVMAQLVEVTPRADAEALGALLRDQASATLPAAHLHVAGALARRRTWSPMTWREHAWSPGSYLVTGGLGGLGLLVARDLLKQEGVRVMLSGRSVPDERARARLAELDAGDRARYVQLDLADPADVRRVVDEVESLTGVIHCAGATRDGSLRTKTPEDLASVLVPKVRGTVNLDAATARLPLEVFALFASTTGVLGNAGQIDYAAANGFMDRWAHERNLLVQQGERHGRTVSIDWSLWAEGGMAIPEALLERMAREQGFAPISSTAGLTALHASIASGESQTLCLASTPGRTPEVLRDLLDVTEEPEETGGAPVPSRPQRGTTVVAATRPHPVTPSEAVLGRVVELLHESLEIPLDWLDPDVNLDQLGLDSIRMIGVIEDLERELGELPKTLFFEYETLKELADDLASERPEAAAALVSTALAGTQAHAPVQQKAAVRSAVKDTAGAGTAASRRAPSPRRSRRQQTSERGAHAAPGPLDFAIVGLAGRYPDAQDVDQLWQNLRSGHDAVSSVPVSRWDTDTLAWRDQRGPVPGAGGFLDGVDHFDPYFFGISPREAEHMDPQERLFLRCAYETIQDAGYRPSDLKAEGRQSTGVFVGLMTTEYHLFGVEAQMAGMPLAVPGNLSSVPNRVSYQLGLKGPSLAVDTMCSSTLSALDTACRAILSGQCAQAIVGGINLTLHPSKLLLLDSTGFMSKTGHCHAFGADADGYVPSEGVGAVLIKPLRQAERDRDHIYAVIKGSCLNHAGRTTGFTVPSPVAQADVISRALEESGVDPATVTYVEAHGTGTKLGDPIEIRGLAQALGDGAACAIGSVKASLGHGEGAAGMASLTKVLLQMRHRTLVPSLHSEQLNPLLGIERTRMAVQHDVAPWEPAYPGGPLRACVSSFGAGGSNAHVVLEDYQDDAARQAARPGPVLVVLSARSEDALRRSAERLVAAIDAEKVDENDLGAIAYTLQVGREAFAWRAGAVVTDLTAMRGFATRVRDGQGLRHVNLRAAQPVPVESLVTLDHQLEAWLAGGLSDWAGVAGSGRRVSLPAYPFEEERYWLFPKAGPGASADDVGEERAAEPEQAVAGTPVPDLVMEACATAVQQVLKIPRDRQDPDDSFQDIGFDSVTIVEIAEALGDALGIDLGPDVLFSHPTPRLLAEHLASTYADALAGGHGTDPEPSGTTRSAPAPLVPAAAPRTVEHDPAVVVGRSVRAAQCDDVRQLWEAVRSGESQILDLAERRPGWEGASRRVAALSDIDVFDPLFFEISPREAVGLDPRARLLLEEMWHALEDAALGRRALERSTVAVFVGVEDGDYQFLDNPDRQVVSNHTGALAARLSYMLDLHGPAMAINTACSSGLVAMHQAVRCLESGECDVAVVAAVNLLTDPGTFDTMAEAGMLSPGGVCAAFSEAADGMVPGEAVAAIVLMRESDAVRDGRQLHGVVRGSGVNYDGRTNGLTAPNGDAQRSLEAAVYAEAGVQADEIGHVIAHGTGTGLGDPIELNALAAAHESLGSAPGTCAVTSVKPVVGHSQAASGLVSLIVLLESLRSGVIPANPACAPLNPHIRLEGRPVSILRRERPWPVRQGQPRVGAVSAFGVSGTNAHVVVSEVTSPSPSILEPAMSVVLPLLVSAKSPEALDSMLLELSRWCASPEAPDLRSVARTLAEGRYHHEYRCAVLAASVMEAASALRGAVADPDADGVRSVVARGQVAQEPSAQMRELTRRLADDPGRESAAQIAALYLAGDLPADLLGESGASLVSAPGYVFSRERFWPQAPRTGQVPASVPDAPAVAEDPEDRAGAAWEPRMVGWPVEERLRAVVSDEVGAVLRLDHSRIDPTARLQSYGFDSITFVELAGALTEKLGVTVQPSDFYQESTVNDVVASLVSRHEQQISALLRAPGAGADADRAGKAPAPAQAGEHPHGPGARPGSDQAPARDSQPGEVVVVGASGQFPQARGVEELWDLVASGRCAIGSVPQERREWHVDDVVRRMGCLERVAEFDARFFDIAPREAYQMDPRQRLLLQEMWHAVEDAALTDEELHGERVGVYVGIEEGDYSRLLDQASVTSNTNSVLAARLSYFLDLSGPCMAINTSCSSGLVALHQARLALQQGDCDTAIVAAANVLSAPPTFDAMADAEMLSPTGRCRAYDSGADGMVPGEAVVALVLQREGSARRRGRRVSARVLATAVNYDGRSNGITAPSGSAQEDVIARALEAAGVQPATLGLVVGHGTGTRLGDPVEVRALASAYSSAPPHSCALMSVKPSIGHTQAAAGLVNALVAIGAMEHEALPPTACCDQPSDYVDWDEAALYLNREARAWPEASHPRRAATSAFGFSGTNAHLILEQGDPLPDMRPSAAPVLLAVSAVDEEALGRQVRALRTWLEAHPRVPLDAVARTLAVGRRHLSHRVAVVCADWAQACASLAEAAGSHTGARVFSGASGHDTASVAGLAAFMDHQAAVVADAVDPVAVDEALRAVAQLYCQGYSLPTRLFEDAPLISLPGYEFERSAYWVRPDSTRATAPAPGRLSPATSQDPLARESLPSRAHVPSSPAEPPEPEGLVHLMPLDEPVPAETPCASSQQVTLDEPSSEPPASPEGQAVGAVREQPAGEEAPPAPDMSEVRDRLVASLARELFVEPEDVDLDLTFSEQGLDSVVGVEWIRAVNKEFGLALATARLYEFPTVERFATMVAAEVAASAPPQETRMLDAPAGAQDDLDALLHQVYDGAVPPTQAAELMAQEVPE